MSKHKSVTFEQWAKGRPLGPRGTMGWMMAEAAWEESAQIERTACAEIALAIDSLRGNEKEIAAAILRRSDESKDAARPRQVKKLSAAEQ